MSDAYREFEAESLFCPRCRRAGPVRRKLLLVLPTGNKYDYVCHACGNRSLRPVRDPGIGFIACQFVFVGMNCNIVRVDAHP